MSGWRFAFTGRWFGWLALAIVFAIVCSFLGTWQLNRRAEAQAEITRIDNNYASEPRPLDEVLPTLDSFDESQKWTPVEMTGQYLADEELLVRNRPQSGQPGFEVLTPLLLEDGTVFVVDRGWLPVGNEQDEPDMVPEPPTGEVTVVARLKAGEPVLEGRGVPAGSDQIATIHLPSVEEHVARDTYTGAYGLMVSENPPAEQRPVAALKPIRDEGPHLSYALQWFVFAIMGFMALGWALRQEYRVINSDDPEEQARAHERERRKAAKAPSDADIEDAILDARPPR
ncbi:MULTISPECIES: SURF1 family protein [unclassified Cryobacterium]|uniref:SURF1 family cytochrome oxidase biogenesis protein n=1 Tax=unclassified Cryobacterium TaxID=2649013 RepID=UPI0014468140|nr:MULTISPECIES: SURF1 family protein [unclassified Cryobacterium]